MLSLPAMRGRVPVSLTTLAAVLSLTSAAQAFERQWHVGGGVGLAIVPGSDYPAGPLLGVHAAYGLSDMFDVRLELAMSRHVLAVVPEEEQWLYGADAAIAYKVDIIEWVPYFGLLAGYHGATKPPRAQASDESATFEQHEVDFGSLMGVDYSFSRSFALGAQIRYHAFLSNLTGGGYTVAALHAEYRWGW
jgi:hypothetical protein